MDILFIIGIKAAYCLLIIIVCAFIIKISKTLLRNFFKSKVGSSKFINERKANTLNSVTASIVKYIIYFIAIFAILKQMNIPAESLIAVAGVGSVAIGFGSQSLVQDVISGFFILLEDQFGVGDIVTIEGKTGTVEDISIRTTHLRAADGTVYIIPNGLIKIVTNMCKDYIKAIVDIDVDYGEDMEHVLEVLNDEMVKSASILTGLRGTPLVLGIISLSHSSVTIRITAECEIKENYQIERELKLLIKNRLDRENITIPFPQRTIHIVNELDKEEVK